MNRQWPDARTNCSRIPVHQSPAILSRPSYMLMCDQSCSSRKKRRFFLPWCSSVCCHCFPADEDRFYTALQMLSHISHATADDERFPSSPPSYQVEWRDKRSKTNQTVKRVGSIPSTPIYPANFAGAVRFDFLPISRFISNIMHINSLWGTVGFIFRSVHLVFVPNPVFSDERVRLVFMNLNFIEN